MFATANMKKTLLSIAAILTILFATNIQVVSAVVSSVWREVGDQYIRPLIQTDSVRAPFFTATSTTATSTFAGPVEVQDIYILGVCTGCGGGVSTTSPNTWSMLQRFEAGLLSQASTTIGNGTQDGGLTINGGATTTGNAYFADKVGIQAISPTARLEVEDNGISSENVAVFTQDDQNTYGLQVFNQTISLVDGFGIKVTNSGDVLLRNLNAAAGDLVLDANDGSSDLVVDNTGAVGLNDAGPDYRLEVAGSLGNGYFGLTNSTDGDIFVVNSSGNVGIASTTPEAKLTVQNTGTNNSFIVESQANETQPFIINASGNVGIKTQSPQGIFDIQFGNGDDGIYFQHGVSDNYKIYFEEATNPTFSLDYSGTGSGDANLIGFFYELAPTRPLIYFRGGGEILVGTTTNNSGKLQIDSPNTHIKYYESDTGKQWHTEVSDSDFRISETAVDERLIISDTTGNVGLGGVDLTPDAALDVEDPTNSDPVAIFDTDSGTNAFHITRSGATSETLQIWVDDSNAYFRSDQDENTGGSGRMFFQIDDDGTTDSNFTFETKSGTDLMVLTNSGRASIGLDSSPEYRLELVGASSNGYFGITETTDGDIFEVDSNGFIGIGTTSPYAKLSVAGETVASHFTATNTAATSSLPTLEVLTALNLFGTTVSSLSELCVALTGSSALCDGGDATGGGGGDSVLTWTPTGASEGYYSTADATSTGLLLGSASTTFTSDVTVVGTTTTVGAHITGAANILGEYFTNFTTYVRSLFSAGTGLTYSAGQFAIDLAANFAWTGTHDFSGATVKQHTYPAFTYATSTTWTGTTTLPLGPAFTAEDWGAVKCFTDAGTLDLIFTDGTNDMNTVKGASTTVGTVELTTNNTFTASEKRFVEVGNPASSPTYISCSVDKIVNN